MTDFIDGLGHAISRSGFRLALPDTSIGVVRGNTPPVSQMPGMTTLSDTAQVLVRAATGEGIGEYLFCPTFELDVPAEAYMGQYVSFVTVQIVSGP